VVRETKYITGKWEETCSCEISELIPARPSVKVGWMQSGTLEKIMWWEVYCLWWETEERSWACATNFGILRF